MEETTSTVPRLIDETGIACYLANDAARLLGVHRKTIARLCNRGELTRIEHLRRVYIPIHEVEQMRRANDGSRAND